jgi:exonuclease III
VRSRGVAILFRPIFKLDSNYSDDAGRLQVVNFSLVTSDSCSFQLVNLYGPNKKNEGEDFFEFVLSKIDPTPHTVVCGDFNTVVNPHVDRRGCNSFFSLGI